MDVLYTLHDEVLLERCVTCTLFNALLRKVYNVHGYTEYIVRSIKTAYTHNYRNGVTCSKYTPA